MAKRVVSHEPTQLNRKQMSHHQRDARMQHWVVLGTGAVLALVVLVLAWGLIDQYILKPRRPLVTVAGEPISLQAYEKLYNYRKWDYQSYIDQLEAEVTQLQSSSDDQSYLLQLIEQQVSQMESAISNLPTSVLNELINDKLIRQEATRRGITVSDDEIEQRLEEQFGYDRTALTPEAVTDTVVLTPTATLMPTATPTASATEAITVTPSPTLTPAPTATIMTYEGYQELASTFYKNASTASGFTEADFRQLVESSLISEKLETALKAEVPTTAEQVHARHILLATQEEADTVLQRLQQGEDFATVAGEVSTDEQTKDSGGDLGWFPQEAVSPTIASDATFATTAFGLQAGELSSVISTTYGYDIIRVDERADSRALDETNLAAKQDSALSDWLTAQRAAVDIKQNTALPDMS